MTRRLCFLASMAILLCLSIFVCGNAEAIQIGPPTPPPPAADQYTYDSLNRLVQVQYGDGTIIQYSIGSPRIPINSAIRSNTRTVTTATESRFRIGEAIQLNTLMIPMEILPARPILLEM